MEHIIFTEEKGKELITVWLGQKKNIILLIRIAFWTFEV